MNAQIKSKDEFLKEIQMENMDVLQESRKLKLEVQETTDLNDDLKEQLKTCG